jgi:hypothetical protein
MRTRASRDTSPRLATQLHIMQPQKSTFAAAADPHATSIEQRTTEYIRKAVLAPEQRVNEQFLVANAALLAQIREPTAAPATTYQEQSIPPDATTAAKGGKAARKPPIDLLDDEPEPTASEIVDFTYYGEVIPAELERPPRDVEEPRDTYRQQCPHSKRQAHICRLRRVS